MDMKSLLLGSILLLVLSGCSAMDMNTCECSCKAKCKDMSLLEAL